MSVQVFCPHFTELCVFLLGYRRSGAFHTLKRALKIVFRTFDQNRCIWAHSVSLRPHPGIPFIPHIIFLSSDTNCISLLTKLTHTFNLQLQHSISAADAHKKPEYSNPIYENRRGVNWISHIVIKPVDQKLVDLQSPSWVDGSVFIFTDFAVLNQINQPTALHRVL